MFRTLGRLIATGGALTPGVPPSDAVFLIHPWQLSRWLEEVWANGGSIAAGLDAFVGDPAIISALALPPQLRGDSLRSGIPANGAPGTFAAPPAPGVTQRLLWPHLSYAYLVESTRIFEIFALVMERYLHGESLEVPSIEGQQWLRTTEELFFRDPPQFHIGGITSSLRPDLRRSRQEAYWRLLGLPLHAGTPHQARFPADLAANVEFTTWFERLLTEVWRGIENSRNTSGANATDPEAIASLAKALADMLTLRRRNGNLAREEFWHVATMSWFHLTVESNTPIVRDLKATASSITGRVDKIAERVGLPASSASRSFFELAEPVSTLLRFVEARRFDDPAGAATLYADVPGNTLREDLMTIITHWSLATGRNLKALPTDVRPWVRPAGGGAAARPATASRARGTGSPGVNARPFAAPRPQAESVNGLHG
ncbi:hypothetical protein [Frankia sp. R43]|uniref:hypothetical protein n=1 Tax=Frankia sp. R43 TaxID=269536 RepID=UPI0006CA1BC4|nr:hypothetical protein [Frankia sp. R43]